VHQDVEFLESDLIGTRMRGDRFAHDVGPLAPQARFEQFALQSQPVGDTG